MNAETEELIQIIPASEMEQGSLEWHELRSKKYPASEAGAVMECNPWTPKNQRELFAARNGDLMIADNFAMARGRKHEAAALAALSKQLDIPFKPVIAVRGEFMASLDGFAVMPDGRTIVAEIKVPMDPEKLAGAIVQVTSDDFSAIPENYFWQIVQQAHCSGADYISFSAHSVNENGEIDNSWFFLAEGDALRKHWPKLKEAWDLFRRTNHEPIEIKRNDAAWIEAARAYSEAKKAVQRARKEAGIPAMEKAEKEAKQRLIEFADEQIKTSGSGVTVTPYYREGYEVKGGAARRVSGTFQEQER